MTSAESAPKEKSYFTRLMRGETYFDPVRLMKYVVENMWRITGTIFQRKK